MGSAKTSNEIEPSQIDNCASSSPGQKELRNWVDPWASVLRRFIKCLYNKVIQTRAQVVAIEAHEEIWDHSDPRTARREAGVPIDYVSTMTWSTRYTSTA